MEELFTNEEILNLIIALGKGQETFDNNDIDVVRTWAEKIMVDYHILQSVLNSDGAIAIMNKDGEVFLKLAEEK